MTLVDFRLDYIHDQKRVDSEESFNEISEEIKSDNEAREMLAEPT